MLPLCMATEVLCKRNSPLQDSPVALHRRVSRHHSLTLSPTCCLPPVVYPDGRVCISILHTPGDDPMGYELPVERWSPVQSGEKVLLSVVSMLAGESKTEEVKNVPETTPLSF